MERVEPAPGPLPSSPPVSTPGETVDLGRTAQSLPRAPLPFVRGGADKPEVALWTGQSAAAWATGLAMLPPGLLAAAALVPSSALEAKDRKAGQWDREKIPGGWDLPRNPSRVPVRPRFFYEVPAGTEDLGQVHVVASSSGRLRGLRLHWPDEVEEPAFSAQQATFRDFFCHLDPEVAFHVVAEGQSESRLRALIEAWQVVRPERIQIHPMHCHESVEQVYEPMTMWARDGAILVHTEDSQNVVLLPRSFRRDGDVDKQLNRVIVHGSGAAPARLSPEGLAVRRAGVMFEGGDVVASRQALLLGGHAVKQTMRQLGLSREAVLSRFQTELGLPILAVEPQPAFHLDVGFTWLDDRTVAVGDPRGTVALASSEEDETLQVMVRAADPGLADRYDQAARSLDEAGYRVVRLPNLAGLALRTPYLTYNNVLIECFGDIRRVYMPVYGWAGLDEMARQVYRQNGFQVVDMPSARLSTRLWGAVRCASGEVDVEPALQ